MQDGRAVTSLVHLLSACLVAGALISCGASGGAEDLGPDAGDASCEPRSCEADDCGRMSDGCGGMLDCGSCGDQGNGCVPLECETGACGSHDDGCQGTIECGSCGDGAECVAGFCQCAADDLESNDGPGEAASFGEHNETSNHMEWADGLTVAAGDPDWYAVGAVDSGGGGYFKNPKVGFAIDASAATEVVRLSVTYECNSDGEAGVECDGGVYDAATNACLKAIAPGEAEAWLYLRPSCSSLNESGVAFAQVTTEGACISYDLGVHVTD